LVLDFRGHFIEAFDSSATIVTEIAGRGSLTSYLSSARGAEMCKLRGETRIARIIVGIVLAMRYIHSQRLIHRDLTPDNIRLDWNWHVHISNFKNSIFSNESNLRSLTECYDNEYDWENDVFSFGLILYELMVGSPAFSKDLSQLQVVKLLVVDNVRPDIPEFVLPSIRTLIGECWKHNPCHRPSFNEILDWLTAIQFKLTRNVNSSKLSRFVKNILALEEGNVIPATRIAQ
jgi:serine/threonine protein kinase